MTAGALPAAPRNKRLVLIACIAGSSVVFLDGFVVNVALPAIREDLGGGLAAQQWIANSYLLVLGSLLLVGGSLGDVFGERLVFSIGAAAFGLTSILCGVAPSVEVLVAGRALQGAAGALLVPATLAVIVATFPEDERGAAIGTWTAWTGIATVLGPLVGGQLVEAASWRWVFYVNVPLIVATLVLVAIAIPPPAARSARRRIDVVGAALAAVGLGAPVFALIEQPSRGWADSAVVVPLTAGVVLLAAFVAWERRVADPMMPLGLFRRRNFWVGNLQTVGLYAGLAALFFFLTIFLQQIAGYDAFEAGIASLPTTAVIFFLSRRFGALSDRFGARPFLTAGPVLAGVGMVLLVRIDASFDYLTDLLPALLVFALGLTMTVAPLTATVLACVGEGQAGIASGVNNAVARVAQLLGIAVIGVFVAAQWSSVLEDRSLAPDARAALAAVEGRPLTRPELDSVPAGERAAVTAAVEDAAVSSFHLGMVIGGGLVIAAGLAAGVWLREPRREVPASDCPGGALVGHPEDEASRSGA